MNIRGHVLDDMFLLEMTSSETECSEVYITVIGNTPANRNRRNHSVVSTRKKYIQCTPAHVSQCLTGRYIKCWNNAQVQPSAGALESHSFALVDVIRSEVDRPRDLGVLR